MALVLVVDDEPDQLALADRCLSKAGHEVVCAADAEEAFAYVRVFGAPDVAVLDVQMPGGSGFELARRVQSDTRIGDFPVIFLTSSVHELDVLEGRKLGQAYIDKAAGKAKLLESVAHAIAA